MSETACRRSIDEFLAQRRFAMIGVSRNPRDFSRELYRAFRKRGYDVIPVRPDAVEIEGRTSVASVTEIQPPVEAALLMTAPSVTETVVPECAAAGIRRIWMYRATGAGAVSPKAVAYCAGKGIEVVPGECPLMFLNQTGWIHRAHGLIRRIKGRYPN